MERNQSTGHIANLHFEFNIALPVAEANNRVQRQYKNDFVENLHPVPRLFLEGSNVGQYGHGERGLKKDEHNLRHKEVVQVHDSCSHDKPPDQKEDRL